LIINVLKCKLCHTPHPHHIYVEHREHMAAAHPGPWREVDNPEEIAAEVRAYGEARRLLRLYTMLLQQIFRHRGETDALAAVDAVAAAIAALPQEIPDLMHGFYVDSPARPWVWQFHAAYLDFSQTDTRSRSWLLSTLPGLRAALTLARLSLSPAELANRGFEGMFKKATDACEAWRALAQPRLRVPQAALRQREEGRRPRTARAAMPAMRGLLAEMRCCKTGTCV
jgi:hypothetical protein